MISEQLKQDIDGFAQRLLNGHDLLQRAQSGRVEPLVVARYLASIHFMLRQTSVHLALAKAEASALGHDTLAEFFDKKAVEECGHEHWAAEDRKGLSRMFDGVAEVEPAAAVVELMRNTKRAIETNPFLYLAYILFAEYFTVLVGPVWLSALEKHCGVPRSVMTAVDHHVELDQHHVADGCEEIDKLATDERLHGPMRDVLRQTMFLFETFCDELCRVPAAA